MFGRGEKAEDVDRDEIKRIEEHLDPGEEMLLVVRQSRVRPGGAAVLTPNTIFVSDRRLLIRNPKLFGFRENIEEYAYDQITSVKLVKGVFSSSVELTIPGMTEHSKADRKSFVVWGREDVGAIDALPKDKAEKMIKIVRERIKDAKEAKLRPAVSERQSPLDLLKTKFVNGEITEEEYERKRKIIEG